MSRGHFAQLGRNGTGELVAICLEQIGKLRPRSEFRWDAAVMRVEEACPLTSERCHHADLTGQASCER
eukprot:CAMPEP_0205917882 /NCGR_PEP_ID=MMETSP1325-20131115/9444_1 /ASSEMBLY_ACC=CAM_ASM_000708 /TAXON_ID=236786 /ORGANISM="Florenciella sp., Strain RCC1007" /LENGTH=67 /DNA_ID=CAMNT_0053285351 /DNA_START=303 /DNA_END=503 /DNA_ORIENTATION=+